MRKLAGVIACCGLAIACSRPPAPEEAKPAPPPEEPPRGGPDLVVGAYLSMTGPEAVFGIATGNGIALAVEEQNRAGGVRGRKIVVRTIDTAGRTSNAAEAVTRLIADERAIAILGEVGSSLTLAGGAVAQAEGVPMISPSATHPEVTRIGDMISRACVLDEAQAIAMARFARTRLQAARVAILYDRTQPYSTGMADHFDKAFKQLGGTIMIRQAFDGGNLDLTPQLAVLHAANADAIFAPVYYTAIATIARKLRDRGVTSPLLGADGWDSPDLVSLGGPALDGSYYVNHFAADDPRPIVKELVKRYRARFGGADPDGLAALGYDAARLLFSAMGRARSLSGKDLAAAIASTRGFHGATGSLTMGPDREPRKSVAILKIEAGKPKLVEMILPP